MSDLVMVQDPGRPPALSDNARRRITRARNSGKLVNAPTMYDHGIPPLCSCVMAYRQTASVRRLLHSAAARFVLGLNEREIGRKVRGRVRQSDQEMIWFQLVLGPSDPALRLLVLPEEYICPSWWPSRAPFPHLPFFPQSPLTFSPNFLLIPPLPLLRSMTC